MDPAAPHGTLAAAALTVADQVGLVAVRTHPGSPSPAHVLPGNATGSDCMPVAVRGLSAEKNVALRGLFYACAWPLRARHARF